MRPGARRVLAAGPRALLAPARSPWPSPRRARAGPRRAGPRRRPAGAAEIVVPLSISAGDLTVTQVEGRHEIALRGAMTPLEAEPGLLAAGGGAPGDASNPLAAGAPALPLRCVTVVLPRG